MTTDAEQVAEQLQGDYTAAEEGRQPVMASLFADTIALHHLPLRDDRVDGPIEASVLRDISIADMAAVGRALTDRSVEKPHISVEGSFIRIRSAVKGTLATGEPIEVGNEVLLEVRDGKIVAMVAYRDAESWAQWEKVLEAGNFQPPAEWVARGH
jgi:hypothetical protein